MAKCKQCKKDVAEGLDYCEECMKDNISRKDESYLDSLLDMVVKNQKADPTINLTKTDAKSYQTDKGDTVGNSLDNSMDNDLLPNNNLEEQIPAYNNNHHSEDNYDVDESSFDTDEDLLKLLDMITSQSEDSQSELESNQGKDSQSELEYDQSKDSQSELEYDQSKDSQSELDNNQSINSEIESNQSNNEISQKEAQSDFGEQNSNIQTDEENQNDLYLSPEIDTEQQNSEDQLFQDDILAIEELLGDISADDSSNDLNSTASLPDDVGKVFSDVVSAVDTLTDDENNVSESTPDVKKLNSELNSILDTAADKSSQKDNKKNIFQRLFKKDKSSDNDIKLSDSENHNKEEKERKKLSKKTKKKKQMTEDEGFQAEKDNKKSKSTKKSKKQADSKKIKKKEKKKPAIEIVRDIYEQEDDNKKINKAAAFIVFLFMGALCLFIIIGTKQYSYSLSIKNATRNFERQRYTEAYNDICGTDVKEEDIDIYNKVLTVMFVNKQLNSYNNYYSIGMYPQALDSLLKGLEKYDKYKDKAKKLGIKEDLDGIRKQILNELDSKFQITEEEAIALNKNSNQEQYSKEVIKAASKK